MLDSQLGRNLRNDVAHGLLSKDDCTKELTEQIIHMYLRLVPGVPDDTITPPIDGETK